MTDETRELARRAVACAGWRWRRGMCVMSDPEHVPLRARVTCTVLGLWYGVGEYDIDAPEWEHESVSGDDLPGTLPDLYDDATRGAVLRLVRDAWGDPTISVRVTRASIDPPRPHRWTCSGYDCGKVGGGETEADALVAALEDAPA